MKTAAIGKEPALLGMKRMRLRLGCGDISYIDEGVGPCILLLHGAPITSLGFLRVIRELKGSYRLLAPDFPGFGLSTAASPSVTTLAGATAFIEEFCRALNLSGFYMFGNDSSGCTALAAAVGLRDRLAGLIVADTVPIPLTGRAHIVKLILKFVVPSWPVRILNTRFNMLPWLVAHVAPFKTPFTKEERSLMSRQYDSREKREVVLQLFKEMGENETFMRKTAQQAELHLSQVPTLILFGQFDPMRIVGGVPRFQRLLQNHSVSIIPMEEHFPILASGARVGREIHRFVSAAETRRNG